MSIFRKTSPRDALFRQALSRDSQRSKKNITRGEETSPAFPYGILSLWAVFFATGIYLLCFSPVMMITEVVVSGADHTSQQRIQDTVETVLLQKHWNIFSKQNYFFIPQGEIRTVLFENYPLLESVRIEKVFPRRIEIAVGEASRLLLWCSGGPCYELDTEDHASINERFFYTAYDTRRLLVVDTSALPVVVGEVLPVRRYIDFFSTLYELFPQSTNLSLEPDAYTPSRYSEELRMRTSDGWQFLTSLEVSPEETVHLVNAFLERRKGTRGGNALPLMTVDMRVPGKIFFSVLKNNQEELLLEEEAALTDKDTEKTKQETSAKKKSKQ